jgi:hypothetical protein
VRGTKGVEVCFGLAERCLGKGNVRSCPVVWPGYDGLAAEDQSVSPDLLARESISWMAMSRVFFAPPMKSTMTCSRLSAAPSSTSPTYVLDLPVGEPRHQPSLRPRTSSCGTSTGLDRPIGLLVATSLIATPTALGGWIVRRAG